MLPVVSVQIQKFPKSSIEQHLSKKAKDFNTTSLFLKEMFSFPKIKRGSTQLCFECINQKKTYMTPTFYLSR